jgi:DNA-binding Lrp family transcriptional regulator
MIAATAQQKARQQTSVATTPLQQAIINNYQKSFPLCSTPYKTMAKALNSTESDVINALKKLNEDNVLSRVGPVFDHKKAGASTLAALAVPPEQLDKIAGIVNQFEQVNHNYAREHRYNLWFVVTASDPVALNTVLTKIELLTGLQVLILPMEASYHIDLSFDVDFDQPHANKSGIDTQGKSYDS